MAKMLNSAMLDSNNLLSNVVDVSDNQGKYLYTVDLATAKNMVNSGEYYIETTEDIVLI